MKSMITGGAGFIGLHLARLLLEKGHTVDLVDNFSRAVKDKDLEQVLSHPNCSLKRIDLLDNDQLNSLDNNYDFIYHLAAIIGVQHVLERPYEVLTENVKLLENLIGFGRSQKSLKRFLFASTSEVYSGTLRADQLEIPSPETSPIILSPLTENRTTYYLSKLYGEAMCHHSKIPYSIFRPHNFYGPRMGMSHVMPELLRKFYKSNNDLQVEVFSPDHTRTFCFIEDAVEMIYRIAITTECEGQFYNIGCSNPEIKIKELAATVRAVSGGNAEIVLGEETPGSPARRCPSLEKLINAINYEPRYSLEEGVQKTFNWYKEHVFDSNGVTAK